MKKKKSILIFMLVIFFLALISVGYIAEKYNNGIAEEEKIKDSQGEIADSSTVIEQEPVVEKITSTVVATGDIMFHSTQVKGAYNPETKDYDFESTFSRIKKYIESADLALANFETVTAGPEHGYRGYPTFNTPKSAIQAIKNAGFDILSTANNHSLDKGKEGIIETIDNINEYGLESFGTYKEPSEDIMIQDVNGIKMALLSYTYGCNGLETLLTPEELNYMVNIINEDKIKNDIQKADELGVDVTTVFIHWGNEYQREPSQQQIDLANKMIEWGADIILGSHPHVVQRSEIVNYNGEDKFIVYSMGNFISNQRRETLTNKNRKYTEDGIVVKLTLEKDVLENKTIVKDIDYIPTWVYRYSEGGKFKYSIMPTTEYLEKNDDGLSQEVLSNVQESYSNTINLMNQR
ncbi:CapA family protein [Brassicibacter mesophilus]|uniref:CapA family protein n=1 Tax=Brassicibacter mesophilus TaxID=745119 RepID=UPI003D1B10AC